ncbi:MAG: beta-lactamase family protein, partial [Acidobacteria bacterium]|nr:beta-lactamase family protein [Acidobacteriota bacterium]
SGRGLGWDLDSSYSTNGGDLFGPEGYGHTGYTGTSVWIDPETETVVVLMTNRVHPDDRGSVVSLRSRVANVVAAAIVDR